MPYKSIKYTIKKSSGSTSHSSIGMNFSNNNPTESEVMNKLKNYLKNSSRLKVGDELTITKIG